MYRLLRARVARASHLVARLLLLASCRRLGCSPSRLVRSARFNQFYGHCIALGGICQSWAALVRLNLRPCHASVKWNCTRFVLAAIHLLYYTLNQSDGGEAITAEEWAVLSKRELLSTAEIDQIRAAGSAVIIPLMWALSEVEHALQHECNGLKEAVAGGGYYSEVRMVDTLGEFRHLAF